MPDLPDSDRWERYGKLFSSLSTTTIMAALLCFVIIWNVTQDTQVWEDIQQQMTDGNKHQAAEVQLRQEQLALLREIRDAIKLGDAIRASQGTNAP